MKRECRRVAPAAVNRKEFMAAPKPKPGQMPRQHPTQASQTPKQEKKPISTLQPRQRRIPLLAVEPKADLFTGAEAATYLRISPATMLRIAREGAVGHVMVGGRVRYLLEDLDRYARSEAPRAGALVGWDRLRAPKTPRKAG